MSHFITEDDLKTFDGWLRYQDINPVTTPREELAEWQKLFAEIRKKRGPDEAQINSGGIPLRRGDPRRA
jgi:hypothetical protein